MSGLAKTGVAAAGLVAAGAFAAIIMVAHTVSAADKPASEPCFSSRSINGFQAADDQTLYIRVGVRDVFRLDLAPGCQGLSFRQSIGLKSVPPGDPFICSAIQAEVVYRDNGFPQSCQVNAMHMLSPDELVALPKRDRP